MLISARSLGHLRLHDEAVLRRVDIAIENAKKDFDDLRITVANLDVAGLEFLAVSDEHDRAIFHRLQRRRLHRDADLFFADNVSRPVMNSPGRSRWLELVTIALAIALWVSLLPTGDK